jgi:hypothetical protein
MPLGVAVCLLVLASPLWARDCVVPAEARIFASEQGGHIFRVARAEGNRSEGTLIEIQDGFRERRVWRARLLNTPSQVIVAGGRHSVITIDTACRFGAEHSVVVYGADGRVVADLNLERLLTVEELGDRILHSPDGRFWAEKAQFGFDQRMENFMITFQWGRSISIHLKTGQIESSPSKPGS